MKLNVLVLGGNGFIGSHIVDQLIVAGHKVRVFDRSVEMYRAPLPGVDYHLGNFDDPFQVAEALQDIDVVCHLISTTVPSTSNLDPIADIQSNLVCTVRLLEQMRQKNIQRFVYLSSGGTIYGNTNTVPIPEDHSEYPICSYGIIKLTIEKYLHMHQQLYQLKPIILRASNPYGPRQGHLGVQGLIATFLKKGLNNEALDVWGDGTVVRDYIYVGDLAKLILNAIEKDTVGIFNAGSGTGKTVINIVDILTKALDRPITVNYKSARNFDVEKIVLDISKTKNEFKWEPKMSLRDGILQHKNWFESHVP